MVSFIHPGVNTVPWCQHGPMLLLREDEKLPRISLKFVCSADRGDGCLKALPLRAVSKNVEYLGPSFCKFSRTSSTSFEPRAKSTLQAQVLFTKETVDVLMKILEDFSDVLCIGCPSIFGEVCRNSSQNGFLLDLDERFHEFQDFSGVFEPPVSKKRKFVSRFAHYNFFNHHFFHQQEKVQYKNFLKNSEKLVVIIDPPFGGRVDAMKISVQSIKQDVKAVRKNSKVSIALVFPYFNEVEVLESFPKLKVCDVPLTYKNHRKMSDPRTSPVRVFTSFKIRKDFGKSFWFCDICDRVSHVINRHCESCNSCTSRYFANGAYRHCVKCKICVKPSWSHCRKCQFCHTSKCRSNTLAPRGCFLCGESGHKQRNCEITKTKTEEVLAKWRDNLNV